MKNLVIVIWLLAILIAGCASEKKVLYYRNPMNPQVTSKTPMKDEMGMDYVPVYAVPAGRQEEETTNEGITISPEEQKIIGVETEPATLRKLVKEIRTVGTVAYDPDLFVAQEEFVGAIKLDDQDLIEAAKKRLRILGMSEKQIAGLEKEDKPQSSLLLPEGKAWVYANFYEYEIEWLKEGQNATVKSIAYPADEFSGQVLALEPIVKGETRTIQARIEVNNSSLKLKPQMYVDVYLKAELPTAMLAVPSEAVLDTGIRKLVYIAKGEGIYAQRVVKTGAEASGYIPILEGISEGEQIVTKANFLIDSQSRLSSGASALYGKAAKEIQHKH